MSLLDGLKDSMKNPLAENNSDMEFVLESDFELALEKATDVKLSPEDIRAILNGDDDIDYEEDDLDNPGDDVDKDYTSELEACKEALEATITELGIDTAGDELDEDDDLDDPELDPEGDDEILSEEALLAEIENIGTSVSEEADIIAQCESLLNGEIAEEGISDIIKRPIEALKNKKAKKAKGAEIFRSWHSMKTEDIAKAVVAAIRPYCVEGPGSKAVLQKSLDAWKNFHTKDLKFNDELPSHLNYTITTIDDVCVAYVPEFFETETGLNNIIIPTIDKHGRADCSRFDASGAANVVADEKYVRRLYKYTPNTTTIESFDISAEEAELIAECESLIADMPEDEEPPADDSAMESPNPGADKNIQVKGIVESDDDDEDDDEDESEEDEDSDKHKHHHEECDDDDEECEKKHHKHDEDDDDESKDDDDEKESEDDDDEKKDKKEKEDDDDEDEEAEESTLESILDNLLGVPM